MALIKKIFAPPVFEDEEKTRVAGVLNVIIWMLVFLVIIRNITVTFTSSEHVGVTLIFSGIAMADIAVAFWLLRIGRVRGASFVIVGFVWVAQTIVISRFGGVRGSNFGVYAVIIILTGLLLGGWEAIGCAVASVGAGVALFLLERNGVISPDSASLAPDVMLTTIAIRFVATGLLIYLYHNGFSKALARARGNERALIEQAREVAVFRALAENAADAVLMSSLEGNITFANRASCEMFGYDHKRQEMVGMQIATLISPVEREGASEKAMATVLGVGSWRGELQQRRKDDSTFHAASTFFAIRDESGRPVALASITRDVTVQKEAEETQQRLQQKVIEAQHQALQELSTPIIPVMERIIVMPLVGNIDEMRARDITRSLLAGIREHRAKFVILDVTGVPVVDSGVANYLNKTIHAARLKGAHTIITGIADAVAETIVDLGIDWSDLDARRNLRTGLVAALNNLGFDVTRMRENGANHGGRGQ